MRDFFLHTTLANENSNSKQALAYFKDLFPKADNGVRHFDGFDIAYSIDNKNKPETIPLWCPEKKVSLFISGHYDIPEDLLVPTHKNLVNDELIVALYETNGDIFFEKLSGNFNVLIHNTVEQSFKVVNSKLGLFPLFYCMRNNELMLSTRLGVFLKILGTENVNFAAIMQYCLYNYPISSSTFIKDVFLMQSGSILYFNQNHFSIKKYWSIEKALNTMHNIVNFKESTNLLDSVLDKIIGRECKKTGSLGLSLTGGWDGRLILAYALKHLSPDKILLYSHGTPLNPDVMLPMASAKKLNFRYVPIFLDDQKYETQQKRWAIDTVKYSDGLRQISRMHYLYNMDVLNNVHGIGNIISGIGGSNLLKISNYRPCDVFNRFVLEIVETDNFNTTLQEHYNYCMKNYSVLFNNIDFNTFLASFDSETFQNLHIIENKTERFIHFLISEIERRYFGAELQSYKHLINNYSPFFDDAFISALVQTVFFNSKEKKGLVKSHEISLLYAKLTSRNSPKLAKEPTDRGFSMYDVAKRWRFPVMLFKYYRRRFSEGSYLDHFNNNQFVTSWLKEAYDKIDIPIDNVARSHKLFMENYFSAMTFLQNGKYKNGEKG